MTDYRKAALVVADRAVDADECRLLLDKLGILADLAPVAPKRRGRPPVDHGHGDYRTYTQGCRCDACREAHRVHMVDRRAAWAADPSAADRAGHGKKSTYRNYHCRCEPCTTANTADVTAYRARRRERALAESGGAS